MVGKVIAKPGQRDQVLAILLQASRLPMPGCEIYIVNRSPSEPDAVYVYEVWESQSDHDASLQMDSVKALIAEARAHVERFEGSKLEVEGGKGLS
jgi:quinol monooxygenase YgiN